MPYSHLEGLNVGSGPHYADGWLNIDNTPPGDGRAPDLIMDIYDIPTMFRKKAFRKAYVGHVLEHIYYDDIDIAIKDIAHSAELVMVVGPCMEKAIATGQPQSLLDAIRAPEEPGLHPWTHKWTPTEKATADAIRRAGYEPNIIPVGDVQRPEWPNPSGATWQTAMWFTT